MPAHGGAAAAGGVGVLAESTAGGTALLAAGAATFTGPAAFSGGGVLTIGAGKSPATRTGAALTPASLILATMRQNTAGVPVQAA